MIAAAALELRDGEFGGIGRKGFHIRIGGDERCADILRHGLGVAADIELRAVVQPFDDVAPLLPKGTMLKVTSWHNNTASNIYNPDPSNWAGFGQRSIDDMSFAWVSYVWLTDEDFARHLHHDLDGSIGIAISE